MAVSQVLCKRTQEETKVILQPPVCVAQANGHCCTNFEADADADTV